MHFTAGLSTDLDGGVLFETGFQDPPEEIEAEEPWGVFVPGRCIEGSTINIGSIAAGKSAVYSVEAAPPGAGDAVYQAGATLLAGGAPGTSRSSESTSSTSSSGTSRSSTSRSGTSRSKGRRRPSGIPKG